MATSKSVVKSRVLFDYTKPDLHGYLYKQGALHKAFKKRYFVLYPGYLVYYSDETKYISDVAKGSLQGRLHAVRIRGGECHHAKESKDAPRGCKFGFTVSAPDPINKRSVYLLNASSREERSQWMAAVKRCQVNVSPKSSSKKDHKEIVSNGKDHKEVVTNGRISEASTTSESTAPPTREAPSKSPDQAADSDSSGEGSIFSASMSSPTPTKYPNTGRRETGVAAALIPVNYNDEDDEDATCTSFNAPYADSDDDIGPEPEIQAENSTSLQDDSILKISNGHLLNGREPSPVEHVNPRVTPSPSHDIASRPTVTASEVTGDRRGDKQLNGGAPLVKTTSPEVTTESIAKAVVSDNLQSEAPGYNSSSEDTDDNPLPVGGHEHNPSDSGTTSDDEDDEIVNPPGEKVGEQATPGIKVTNPSLPRKPPLQVSTSSPSLPVVEGTKNEPPVPVRRTSTPFLQKTGYLHKRGGKRQNWKERFFVLTPGVFTYYKNDVQRTKPVGEVKLKNSSVHIPKAGEHKDLPYQFTVHTESQWNKRSNYVLAANTEQDMLLWIEAFKAAGQKVIMDIPPVGQAESSSNTVRPEYDQTDDDDDDSPDEDDNDNAPQPVNPPPTAIQQSKDSEKKKPKKSIWMSPFRERRRSSKSSLANSDDKKVHPKNLRGMVSKQKRRYQDGNYDLDLSYITEQIIAMGFPSEGAESMYRNKLSTVISFLENKHRYHYKLYNLCSERVYAACKFKNRVAYYPFDDHSAPPLILIEAFCQDVAAWLNLDKRNMAVVHCKAGKGRTGCMIASYLLYNKSYSTADEAMKYFGSMRTHNSKGVTIPSQQRYVRYVEKVLASPSLTFSSRSMRLLSKVVMHTVPNFDTAGGCNPYIVILCNHEEVYTSKKPDSSVEKRRHEELVEWQCAVTMSGDVRVEFWDSDRFSDDDLMCCFHFNTLFIENDKIMIPRKDMDRACKNKKAFTDSFAIELFFAKQLKGMFSKSIMT